MESEKARRRWCRHSYGYTRSLARKGWAGLCSCGQLGDDEHLSGRPGDVNSDNQP